MTAQEQQLKDEHHRQREAFERQRRDLNDANMKISRELQEQTWELKQDVSQWRMAAMMYQRNYETLKQKIDGIILTSKHVIKYFMLLFPFQNMRAHIIRRKMIVAGAQ